MTPGAKGFPQSLSAIPQYAIVQVESFPERRLEVVYGATEVEGMQQRHCAVNIVLCCAIARCGKVNRSQLLISPMLMLLRHAA
jgi:hypothetical protein